MNKLIFFSISIIWFSFSVQGRNLKNELSNNLYGEFNTIEVNTLQGEGTEASPYKITSLADLHYLSQTPSIWDAHFILTANIDATETAIPNSTYNNFGMGFSPIGDDPKYGSRQNIAFTGTFNGQNYTINNLYINHFKDYQGLFGYVQDAQITNLGLTNITINAIYYNYAIGALVGYVATSNDIEVGPYPITSTISNCFSSGQIVGDSYDVGGLLGYIEATSVSNCYSTCSVNGDSDIGGLIGAIGLNSTVQNCYSSGLVSGDYDMGGLIGWDYGGDPVIYSFWDKITSGQDYSAGGIGLSTTQFGDVSNFTGWDFVNTWQMGAVTKDPFLRPRFLHQEIDNDVFIARFSATPTTGAAPLEVAFTDQSQGNPTAWLWDFGDGNTSTSQNPAHTYSSIGAFDISLTVTNVTDSSTTKAEKTIKVIPYTGTGTEGTPYQISSLEDLHYLSQATYLWDKYFILTNDIDASATGQLGSIYNNNGEGFSPIGDSPDYEGSRQQIAFTGSFNGNEHIISNLYIYRSSDCLGLFGYTNAAHISNLALENCIINNETLSQNNVGALIGLAFSTTITACYSSGNTYGYYDVGGLIGEMEDCTVENSYSTTNVTGNRYVGGFMGRGIRSSLENSYSSGMVNGSFSFGGLTGYASELNATSLFWDIKTSNQTSSFAGTGLTTNKFAVETFFAGWDFTNTWQIGATENDTYLRPRFKWQNIEANPLLAVFQASPEMGTVPLEVSFSDISTGNPTSWKWDFGNGQTSTEQNPVYTYSDVGIFGVSLIISDGSVNDTMQISDLITVVPLEGEGTELNPYQIDNLADLHYLSESPFLWNKHFILTSDIDADSTSNAGTKYNNNGLGFSPIGSLQNNFTGSFNGNQHTISNLFINRDESYLGLFGYINNAQISRIGIKDVNISSISKDYIGAICGNTNYSSITYCFSSGMVKGSRYVGGLIGVSANSSIENSYSLVTINGNSYSGGLIGYASYLTIINCYASGINNTSDGGMISGSRDITVTSSYWDKETSGINTSNGGTPLTTVQFANESNFENWDFSNTWQIGATEEDAYLRPRFNWQALNNVSLIAGFKGTQNSGKAPLEVAFSDQSNGSPTSWLWNFGDGQTSTQQNPTHTYSSAGTYTISLIVSNGTINDTINAQNYITVLPFNGNGTIEQPFEIQTLADLHYLSQNTVFWDKHFILVADIDADSTAITGTIYNNSGKGFSPIGDNGNGTRQKIVFTGSFNGQGHFISNLYMNRNENYLGLFGFTNGAEIDSLHLSQINITSLNDIVGGFVGYALSTSISNSSCTGNINADDNVGGIVGLTNTLNISNTYVNTSVKGDLSIGGLIGKMSNGTVNNCYSTSQVNGNSSVGGLIGNQNSGTANNSYASGKVQGNSNVGGFTGRNSNGIANSTYWDVQSSGQTTSALGKALQTIDFMSEANFADWDFSNTWHIGLIEQDNYIRPRFQWQPIESNTFFAGFSAEPTKGVSPLEVNFTNISLGDPTSWHWDFGDGQTSTEQNPTHIYSTKGDFNVEFIIGKNGVENDTILAPNLISIFPFTNGDGTVSNPYQLATLADLHFLSNATYLWDEHFVVVADIDADSTSIIGSIYNNDGKGFSPIGDGSNGDRQLIPFSGSLNGQGHTITNLSINRDGYYIGLFGYISNAKIDSLIITDASITTPSWNYNVSILAGYTLNSTITACQTSGTISDAGNAGGIIGYAENSNLYSSSSNSTIIGDDWEMGGLIGALTEGLISNCFANCTITSTRDEIGGLIGSCYGWGPTVISNCYSIGSITGDEDVAGLIGNASDAIIVNCYSSAQVNGNSTGGFISGWDPQSVTSSYWDTETSFQTTSPEGGEPLTTVQFADSTNFIDWDFANIWQMGAIVEDPYIRPRLKYQEIINYTLLAAFTATPVQGNTPIEVTFTDNSNGVPISWLWYFGDGETSTEQNPIHTYTQPGIYNVMLILNNGISTDTTLAINYVSAFPFNGDGNEESPYTISNLYDLHFLSQLPAIWDKHFVLTADIQADSTALAGTVYNNNGLGFSPIGDNPENPARQGFAFTGTFSGQGHTISNLYISHSTDNLGLFGYTLNSTIDSLGVKNITVVSNANYSVGALIGKAESSTISNSYTSGTISGKSMVGGLIGYSRYNTISNSYSTASVTGTDISGGLVGSKTSGNINNCYSSGVVFGEDSGGLVGRDSNDDIIACYWDINTSQQNKSKGGGEGLTTTLFSDSLNFTGWDFNNIWKTGVIDDDNYVRPRLQWQELNTMLLVASFNSEPNIGKTPLEVSFNDQSNGATTAWDWDFGDGQTGTGQNTTHTYNIPGFFNVKLVISDGVSSDSLTAFKQIAILPYLGDGTEANPYQITCLYDLDFLSEASFLWDKHFILTANIDADSTSIPGTPYNNNGLGFSPIGDSPYDGQREGIAFTGSLNGKGHTINNLYINYNTNFLGLFGCIQNAQIDSLGIGNINIQSNNDYVGALAGRSYSSEITNSFSSGRVGGKDYVGGFIGYLSSGGISNSYSMAKNYGSNYTGGLIGYIYGGDITNCYSSGYISRNYSTNGGLIGDESTWTSASITYSYWDTETSNRTISAGGEALTTSQFANSNNFMGWDFNNIWQLAVLSDDENTRPRLKWQLIDENTLIAEFTSSSTFGNIPFEVSFNDISYGYITSWQWDFGDGQTSTEQNPVHTYLQPGSYNVSLIINNLNNRDTLIKQNYVVSHEFNGVGTVENPFQIETLKDLHFLSNTPGIWNNHFELQADIDADSTSIPESIYNNNGIGFSPIGDSEDGGRQQIAFTGSFNGQGHVIRNLHIDNNTGRLGLFGCISNASIDSLGIENIYIHSTDGRAGALIGLAINSEIDNCYSSGEISAAHRVGGLIGSADGNNVSNSYSLANVNCIGVSVGGLIGIQLYGTITNCYASGLVEGGSSNIGGLMGYSSSTVTNSFWDIETSQQTTSAGGKGVTTSQFNDSTRFVNWDYSNVWKMGRINVDHHYRPRLQWQALLEMLADINSFSLSEQCGQTNINFETNCIEINIPGTLDLTNVLATFTLSNGASAYVNNVEQISGLTANNFSDTVTYTVTQADSSVVQDWKVIFIPTYPIVEQFSQLIPVDSTFIDKKDKITFSWFPIENAELYDLYFGKDSMVLIAEDIEDIQYTYNYLNFSYDSTYFWKVVAKNGCNSHSSSTIQFTIKLLPDLHVTTVSNSQPVMGESIDISWTVQNDGPGETPDGTVWLDRVWLSQDLDVRIGESENILLGTFSNVKSLEPGENYTQNQQLTIPYGIIGSYNIFVVTDASDACLIKWTDGGPTHPYNPPPYLIAYSHSLSKYNVVPEVSDNGTYNDNFFYKEITIDVPPLPDLQITSVIAPNIIFSGMGATITWTGINTGETSTTSKTWDDAIYLSSSPTFNIDSCIYLGKMYSENPSHHYGEREDGSYYFIYTEYIPLNLQPNTTYNKAKTVTLPEEISGTYFIYVISDYYDEVFEHLGETNNILRSDPINIILAPPPDLTVSLISKPETLNPGINKLEWQVQTTENVDFPTWNDQVYLSKLDNDTSFVNATTLYTYNDKSGDNFLRSADVHIPDSLNGWYYLYVKTDFDNKVDEYYKEGNNIARSINPIYINSLDIAATNFIVADTSYSGQQISVAWTTTNLREGAISNKTWTNQFYLSQSAIFNQNNAIPVGEFTKAYSLDTLQHETNNTQLFIPNGLDGTYYLYVFINANGELLENGKIDNNVLSRPIKILLSPPPDLYPTAFSVPNTTIAGSTITFNFAAINKGSAEISKNRDYSIYISAEDSLNINTARYIRDLTINNPASLQVNQFDTPTGSITIPAELTQGDYYLYLIADAKNQIYEHDGEDNNILQSNPITINAYPPVDFKINQFSLLQSNQLFSGETVNLRFEVENDSENNSLNSSWTDAIYLSTDTVLNREEDLLLNTGIFNKHVLSYYNPISNINVWGGGALSYKNLLAHANYQAQLQAKIPNGLSAGNYYFIVSTDDSLKVHDSNRVNNIKVLNKDSGGDSIAFTPPPDLQVSNIAPPPTTAAGQNLYLEYTVSNLGSGKAIPYKWIDNIYLSTDEELSKNDYLLGTENISNDLSPDESYTKVFEKRIPTTFSGNYYVFVETDASNQVYEHFKEDNNINSTLLSIQNTPCDLITKEYLIPDSVILGETLTVEWILQNNGTNAAIGQITEAVYLSKDKIFDNNDILLQTLKSEISLDPNSQISHRISAISDNIPLDKYYVLVKTDAMQNFPETNEDNNTTASNQTVNIDITELVIDEEKKSNIGASNKQYYKLNITSGLAGESLFLELNSQHSASNKLYIRYADLVSSMASDYSATNIASAEQNLIIPELLEGTYYIMVESNAQPQITVKASILNFEIVSIETNTGVNAGTATSIIMGAKFEPVMNVRLVNDEGFIHLDHFQYNNPSSIAVTFNLEGAKPGVYDVVAELQDGTETTLIGGYTITPGTKSELKFLTDIAESVRINRVCSFSFDYENEGGTDINIDKFLIESLSQCPVAFTVEELDSNNMHIYYPIEIENVDAGTIPPNSKHSFNVYFYSTGKEAYARFKIYAIEKE